MKCLHPTQFVQGSAYVPCGQCKPCRLNRKAEWVTKLKLEQKFYGDQCAFVTLTYAPDTLPLSNRFKGGILYKEHAQLFMKRFRKNYKKAYDHDEPIRYFTVGEYGEKSGNAHFHIILFGVDHVRARSIVEKSWQVHPDYFKVRDQYYCDMKMLNYGKLIGRVQCADLRKGGFAYVTGYVMKKLTNPDSFADRRNPEFALQSRKPALGHVQIPAIVQKMKDRGMEPALGLFDDWLVKHGEQLYRNIFNGILGSNHHLRLDRAFLDAITEYFYPLKKYENNALLNTLDGGLCGTIDSDGWRRYKVHKKAAIDLQFLKGQNYKQSEEYEKTIQKTEKYYRRQKDKRSL
jgi:hypothetical protein